MGLINRIKDLFSGNRDHVDTVQRLDDNEVAQNLQDGAIDMGTNAQDGVHRYQDK